VLAELVLAHICASVRYKEIGKIEKSEECLGEVRTVVDRLAHWPKSIDARWARAMYFLQTGQEDRVLADFQEHPKAGQPIRTFDSLLCAGIFYRRHQNEQALDALDWADKERTRVGVASFARAYIEMENVTSENDRSAMVKRYVEGLNARRQSSAGVYLYFDWTVLRLLGEDELATEVATQYRDACRAGPIWEPWVAIAEFMLKERSQRDLLEANRDYRMVQAMSEFAVANDSIAGGDRDGAREHFQAVLKQGIFSSYMDMWSRLFLDRMQESPNWLPCPAARRRPTVPGR
jgi:hypothetical protein